MSATETEDECIFCNKKNFEDRIVLVTCHFYVIKDIAPVNEGHLLLIPKRHTENMFSLTTEEWNDLQVAIKLAKEVIIDPNNPDGYNFGVNCGEAAGQTVFHTHFHFIPRYKGDVENPRGGIRNIKKPLKEW